MVAASLKKKAFALTLVDRHAVTLWTWQKDHCDAMRAAGENREFLPGYALPPEMSIEHDLARAVEQGDLAIVATPVASGVASVASPPPSQTETRLAKVQSAAHSLPASAASCRPLDLRPRGKRLMRRAVCPSAGTYGSAGAPGEQSPGATQPTAYFAKESL